MTDPLTSFSADDATEHWKNGGGATVRLDMSSHMTTGGGSVFKMSGFSEGLERVTSNCAATLSTRAA